MKNLEKLTKKKLGEILLEEGYLTQEQLQEALEAQRDTGKLLGELLVERGVLTERAIARAIATQFQVPYLGLPNHHINKDIVALLPAEMLYKYQFVPLDRFGSVITILMAGVLNADIVHEIQNLTGCELFVFIGTSDDVKKALEEYAPIQRIEPPKKAAAAGGMPEDWAKMFDQADQSIQQSLDKPPPGKKSQGPAKKGAEDD